MRSNTPIVFVPLVVLFVTALLLHVTHIIPANMHIVPITFMIGYMFVGTAIAQIRSEYFWANLAPGNRGKHKSENITMFIASNVLNIFAGVLIWIIGIVSSFSMAAQ